MVNKFIQKEITQASNIKSKQNRESIIYNLNRCLNYSRLELVYMQKIFKI